MTQSDLPPRQIGIQSNTGGDIDIGDSNTFNIAGGDIHIYNRNPKKVYIFQFALGIPSLVLLLLSFKDLAKPTFLTPYLVATPVVGGILVVGALSLLIISLFSAQKNSKKGSHNRSRRILIITNTLSAAISLVSSSLLTLVLIHPPDCPTFLCTTPQIITKVATSPHSINDGYLEMYPLPVQAASFVIPGDPVQYTQKDLPQTIGAVRFDTKPSLSLYRVVVGIHSLQRGPYGVILQQVGLEILQRSSPPHPLNIWNTGSPTLQDTHLYKAIYSGEFPRSVVRTTYADPQSTVSLSPGEPDQLDIQIRSLVPADIQFHIQIIYRITNEGRSRSLTLPTMYEVVFSNASNWNVYQYQYGHFVLNP